MRKRRGNRADGECENGKIQETKRHGHCLAALVVTLRARCLKQGFSRAIVLFWLAFLGACAALHTADFDPPTLELVGIKPLKSDGMEARFQLSVRVVNPNASALEVKGVYYELYIEGNKVLTGASSDAAIIPAFGDGRLELAASASMFGSFALLAQLLDSQPEDGVAYELKAKISVAGLPTALRINRQGTFAIAGK